MLSSGPFHAFYWTFSFFLVDLDGGPVFECVCVCGGGGGGGGSS